MSGKQKKTGPCAAARGLAWVLTFMLTGLLALTLFSFAARHLLTPAEGEGSVQLNETLISQEAELAEAKIRQLAEVYPFQPETVLDVLDRETLTEMSRQSAAWWRQLLTEASLRERPDFETEELETALFSDPGIMELRENEAESTVREISAKVKEILQRTVLPMRQPVLSRVMKELKERFDLKNLIDFATGLPWALLALCAVIAGLIALVTARKMRLTLKYLGAAFGGAVLTVAAVWLAVHFAGLIPLIRESSESMARQAEMLANRVLLREGAMALAMALGSVACLFLYRRGGKREKHEA